MAAHSVDSEALRWFHRNLNDLLHKSLHGMTLSEAFAVKAYMSANFDSGAVRTLFQYLGHWIWDSVCTFCFEFYCTYFSEATLQWKCRNASACCVALLRKMWYDDFLDLYS